MRANLPMRWRRCSTKAARSGTSRSPRWRSVPERMLLTSGTPSQAAADVVLSYAENGRGWPRPLDMSNIES